MSSKVFRNMRFRRSISVLLLGGAMCFSLSALGAAGDGEARDAIHHVRASSHHAHPMNHSDAGYVRSLVSYDIPSVSLVDSEGKDVSLVSELNSGGPVMLNFIFTTCTAICPVLSATFSQVEKALEHERDDLRMVSISIDPEQDTPSALREYSKKYRTGPEWRFLTGSLSDIVAVQKAFGAYRGNKNNHIPLTLLRASPGTPWLRIEGFASAADLVREYRKIRTE